MWFDFERRLILNLILTWHNSSLTLWHLTLPLLVVLVVGEPPEPPAAVAPHGVVVDLACTMSCRYSMTNSFGLEATRDTPEVHLAGRTAHEVAPFVDGHRQLLHPEPRAEGALPVAVLAQCHRSKATAQSSACNHREAQSVPHDQCSRIPIFAKHSQNCCNKR